MFFFFFFFGHALSPSGGETDVFGIFLFKNGRVQGATPDFSPKIRFFSRAAPTNGVGKNIPDTGGGKRKKHQKFFHCSRPGVGRRALLIFYRRKKKNKKTGRGGAGENPIWRKKGHNRVKKFFVPGGRWGGRGVGGGNGGLFRLGLSMSICSRGGAARALKKGGGGNFGRGRRVRGKGGLADLSPHTPRFFWGGAA